MLKKCALFFDNFKKYYLISVLYSLACYLPLKNKFNFDTLKRNYIFTLAGFNSLNNMILELFENKKITECLFMSNINRKMFQPR